MNDDSNTEREPLIPGLPDEVAELCLLHLPYPYHFLLRSVSFSWNIATSNPSFLHTKHSLSLSQPYLFVLSFHKPTSTVRCQALHPSTATWFFLPPAPFPATVSFPEFACAALPRQGKLFVMCGTGCSSSNSNLVYSTATNTWSSASPMPTAKSLFAAETVSGKIVTVGGSGTEIYDTESDTWRWPFMFGPRGWVYDCDCDTWQVMRKGMREGWTGMGVGVGGRVFVVTEYGECQVKVYDEESDTWQYVGGDRFPSDVMRRPFAVRGFEEKIYVVSGGLNVAIGSVVICEEDDDNNGVRMRWEVVEAPKSLGELSPWKCQVLYA
ncbi:putative F-box domain, kelch-type beta propeller [Lupinus albus]|uniref:Putative F-box domain, kelch-type beta propeller n=1 Tax=Lupinus albus TaxID=3870 RepID=A0A6A4MUY6_LUPAL|nr:putative F-box domain, kelch-type beta propeller [Lupinus albus]